MASRTKATIEDLYQIKEKAELVDGEIVFMSPTAGKPNFAASVLTLDELLAGVTPKNLHGEWDTGYPVGKEIV